MKTREEAQAEFTRLQKELATAYDNFRGFAAETLGEHNTEPILRIRPAQDGFDITRILSGTSGSTTACPLLAKWMFDNYFKD